MIKRDLYLKRIRPFMNKDLVKVITGIRRCGKSVMLEIIQDELAKEGVPAESMLAYNFESMTLSHLCTAEALHHDVMAKAEAIPGKAYLFFDEVQEVKDWERAVNSFRVDLDCDIYITGSNSKLLSGELATYLAGRYVEFVMYPLSFREFFDFASAISRASPCPKAFSGTCASVACLIFGILNIRRQQSGNIFRTYITP